MPQFPPYVSIIDGAENIPSCSIPRRYEPPWAPCSGQKVLLVPSSQGSAWFWGPQADLWGPMIHAPTRQQGVMLHAQHLPGIERCSDKGGDWGTFRSPIPPVGFGRGAARGHCSEEGSAVGLSLQHLPSPSKHRTPSAEGSSAAPRSFSLI